MEGHALEAYGVLSLDELDMQVVLSGAAPDQVLVAFPNFPGWGNFWLRTDRLAGQPLIRVSQLCVDLSRPTGEDWLGHLRRIASYESVGYDNGYVEIPLVVADTSDYFGGVLAGVGGATELTEASTAYVWASGEEAVSYLTPALLCDR